MPSTSSIRESTSGFRRIGTGVPAVASAQNTGSESDGVSTGDAGRLPGSIGPEKKK
jgi:hypothetical protein